MDKAEAIKLLDSAPQDDKPSRINKGITRRQSVKIVRDYIESHKAKFPLAAIYEKRVHQVNQDRKRPKY